MPFLICKFCNTSKPSTDFYPSRGQRCKSCCNLYGVDYTRNTTYYQSKYGITLTQYNHLLHAQDNKCAICCTPHQEMPNKKWARARLSVDHDHVTGKVRGLLCSKCNCGLGLLGDTEARLKTALDYLGKSLNLKQDFNVSKVYKTTGQHPRVVRKASAPIKFPEKYAKYTGSDWQSTWNQ